MTFLLDTNAVRDLMDDHPRAKQRLARATAAQDYVSTCSIVRGEVLFGIERLPAGGRRDRLIARSMAAFRSLAEEAVPFSAGEHYALLKRSRE
jgi:predicted nucleic acid-binding protein